MGISNMDCLDIEDGDVATLGIKHGWNLATPSIVRWSNCTVIFAPGFHGAMDEGWYPTAPCFETPFWFNMDLPFKNPT
jgi:hypothetical protein